jgi:hypothetical protein
MRVPFQTYGFVHPLNRSEATSQWCFFIWIKDNGNSAGEDAQAADGGIRASGYPAKSRGTLAR